MEDTTDKGSYPEQRISTNQLQKDSPIEKCARDFNRNFTKEDIQMDNKKYKKVLNIISNQENTFWNNNQIPLHSLAGSN